MESDFALFSQGLPSDETERAYYESSALQHKHSARVVCREVWSANEYKIDHFPRRHLTLSVPIIVRGDPLPHLPATQALEPGERARGLCWGVDLTSCTLRKKAREAKRRALQAINGELDAHPQIKRICIPVLRPTEPPHSRNIKVPPGLALRLHNDLERDRGMYVPVTVIDITGCDDPELLHTRVREALGPSARWSDLSVTWNEIAENSLHDRSASLL